MHDQAYAAPESLVDLLSARGAAREGAERRRLARRLLLQVVNVPLEGRYAAVIARVAGELRFIASPELDDVDLKLAAFLCAGAAARGDDVGAVRFSKISQLRRICAGSPRGLERFVDEQLFGLSSTPAR